MSGGEDGSETPSASETPPAPESPEAETPAAPQEPVEQADEGRAESRRPGCFRCGFFWALPCSRAAPGL